ncbi:unannotated protein [freshwater metagenome]|uniref:Unannotated protein n=1 Tax=freshwater metagenome TaxID=449393 RepID=A0A6J6WZZ6_9ZZZZ
MTSCATSRPTPALILAIRIFVDAKNGKYFSSSAAMTSGNAPNSARTVSVVSKSPSIA